MICVCASGIFRENDDRDTSQTENANSRIPRERRIRCLRQCGGGKGMKWRGEGGGKRERRSARQSDSTGLLSKNFSISISSSANRQNRFVTHRVTKISPCSPSSPLFSSSFTRISRSISNNNPEIPPSFLNRKEIGQLQVRSWHRIRVTHLFGLAPYLCSHDPIRHNHLLPSEFSTPAAPSVRHVRLVSSPRPSELRSIHRDVLL
jgi:hypothetical protein